MTRARSISALLLCTALSGARIAQADPSPTDISSARQAFETAVALETDQKWAEATLKLRQALAVKDTPGLRFHLAHCEEQQGLLVEASLDYDRASELLRQGAKAPDVQKLLAPASADVKRRIPHVTVEIPSDVQSPLVELDGNAYAPSELALGQALNPGQHRLKVSASGRSQFERAFWLKEGDQLALRAELRINQALATGLSPAAEAPSVQPIPSLPKGSLRASPPRRRSSPKLYLLLGESVFTVAGLAVGVGYGLVESSARNRVQAAQSRIDQAAQGNAGACSSPDSSLGQSCAELRTAIDDHDRDATVSTVGFVAAGAGAAALVTTWLAYPSADAESAGPSLQPVIALGRVGLRGRF